ncbi:MAG: fructosamine kinase family protein [Woeseiaceae bacterium]
MGEQPFVKTGPVSALDMFEAEAEGLREIAATDTIRVPNVIDCGTRNDEAFIALENLSFGRADKAVERTLGEQLAAMHGHTSDQHGWHRDNTIGLTPQHNDRSSDWVGFFREHRLLFQLRLAAKNGYMGELQELGNDLAGNLDALFDGYDPAPSLLHGDLWAGNWGAVDGEPVIFDPAAYYGDRETDIAMTYVFGGFGHAFYEAYESNWPLDEGFAHRNALYQLYHILNHLNLFGSGYLGRAMSLLARLT